MVDEWKKTLKKTIEATDEGKKEIFKKFIWNSGLLAIIDISCIIFMQISNELKSWNSGSMVRSLFLLFSPFVIIQHKKGGFCVPYCLIDTANYINGDNFFSFFLKRFLKKIESWEFLICDSHISVPHLSGRINILFTLKQ